MCVILALNCGTLMELGISPIVTSKCSFDNAKSFFVEDSIDMEDNGKVILGDDDNFACNVGCIKFFTPIVYFGLNHLDCCKEKCTASQQLEYTITPKIALETRVALQSGYLQAGILLVLCRG